MKNYLSLLEEETYFYITPDFKRGIGLESVLPNYHIICTYLDPLIPVLRKQGAKIFCLRENDPDHIDHCHTSGGLLANQRVKDYIRSNTYKNKVPGILVLNRLTR